MLANCWATGTKKSHKLTGPTEPISGLESIDSHKIIIQIVYINLFTLSGMPSIAESNPSPLNLDVDTAGQVLISCDGLPDADN